MPIVKVPKKLAWLTFPGTGVSVKFTQSSRTTNDSVLEKRISYWTCGVGRLNCDRNLASMKSQSKRRLIVNRVQRLAV